MKKFFKCNIFLMAVGGILYGMVEILWRHYTHWTMILTGGTCFAVLYRIFQKISLWSVWLKCITGSAIITLTELIAGYIFNIKMHMKVWDYSRQPLNFHGQICPLYSALWGVLTIPILALCGFISRKLEL